MGPFSKDTSHTVKPAGKDSLDMRRGSSRVEKCNGRIARLSAGEIRLGERDVMDRNRRP